MARLLFLAALLLVGCGRGPQLEPLSTDAVILAFGDSLTYGTGARPEESYPAVLDGLIGRRVINAGVPGEESDAALERLPALLEEVEPDLVILAHGGNDMLRKRDLGATAANLSQMVVLARDSGAAVVLLGIPRPGIFLNTAALYERVSEDLGVPLEDGALADILSRRDLKSDNIHPNASGYRELAEAVRRLLRESGAI